MSIYEERAHVVFQARRHAGLSCQRLMSRFPSPHGYSEADVWRMESGDYFIFDDYVKMVLIACGLPENWSPS